MKQPWIERYVDAMGLVVALSGEARFTALGKLKKDIAFLPADMQSEVRSAIKQRFTPSNGSKGCASATAAVQEVAP